MPELQSVERALGIARVLLLADSGEPSPVVEQQTPIADRVLRLEADHHEVCAAIELVAHGIKRLGPEQRRIAVEDQHVPLEVLERLARGLDRIGRAKLLGLHEDLKFGRCRGFGYVLHARTDHKRGFADSRSLRGAQHMRDHRRAGDLVQYLGERGLHARALAGGKNDGEGGGRLRHEALDR